MRKKQFFTALMISALLTGTAVFAEEAETLPADTAATAEATVDTESQVLQDLLNTEVNETSAGVTDGVETVTGTEEGGQPADETVEEVEEETEDFVEGSALLSDYNYEAGTLTDKGWESKFLNLKFTPAAGITMGLSENAEIAKYHERNGKDKQVAINEMVALDDKEGYVQIMAEVNPNRESAEDILKTFIELEKLELPSKTREMEIGGKKFLACAGVIDKQRFMLGVCTEMPELALVIKSRFTSATARSEMLACFEPVVVEEEETEMAEAIDVEEESETETSHVVVNGLEEASTEEEVVVVD